MIGLMIDKFKDEGINTEILSGIGFFTPIFAFHVSLGSECLNFWFQFPNVQYEISFTKTRKRLKELVDESTIFHL